MTKIVQITKTWKSTCWLPGHTFVPKTVEYNYAVWVVKITCRTKTNKNKVIIHTKTNIKSFLLFHKICIKYFFVNKNCVKKGFFFIINWVKVDCSVRYRGRWINKSYFTALWTNIFNNNRTCKDWCFKSPCTVFKLLLFFVCLNV